jgi:hypothetical protein
VVHEPVEVSAGSLGVQIAISKASMARSERNDRLALTGPR